MWEIGHRQLLSQLVGHFVFEDHAVGLEPVIHFGARVGMGDRDLERFGVHLLSVLDSLANRLARLARQSDDEIGVDFDAGALAVLDELQRSFCRDAFLDVLQYLLVAGFETDDEEAAAGVAHRLESLVIEVGARSGGPLEFERFERLAHLDHPLRIEGEGVVVEEDLLQPFRLERVERPLDFVTHVFDRTLSPAVVVEGLRPQAEGAERRASARRIERDERVEQKRHVVTRDVHVAFVDRRHPREFIQLLNQRLRDGRNHLPPEGLAALSGPSRRK